jgi:hypothetical protein
MKIPDSKYLKILVPAVILLLVLGFMLRGRRNETSEQAPAGADKFKSLFQFMSFAPDDETTLPLDPSKIESYEITEEKFIRNIILEKNPVCVGEDFLVTVEASNPNGPDANLVVRIGNRPGNPAILRFTRAGEREFYVVVRDEGKHIEYKKVSVTVRDCPDRPFVFLKASLHATKPETAEFEVADIKGLQGTCSYEWDFGDGKNGKTNTGYATHNYGMREQTMFLSTFTAKVTVTDGRKNQAVGRATVSFPNIHFISQMMGSPIIPVIYNRFPDFSGGRYEAGITMKNIFDESIAFSEAEIEYRPCDSSGESVFRSVGAGALLSQTALPGKGTVEDRLVFYQSALPKGTCNIIVKLNGRMAGDIPVTASVYLDIPPKSGDAVGESDEGKRDQVVADKEMTEKLEKAARILGKDRPITPDDIRRLEKEGKI